MNILALDIGTTSMRGILYGDGGVEICSHCVPTPIIIDEKRGFIEQLPQAYTRGVSEICRAVSDKAKPDAITVTAFRSAPTLVDRNGEALCNFIMWQDTRNSSICERLAYADEAVYNACGAPLNTVFTATKLAWLKENAPEIYARAYKAMIVPDYVVHFMTGVFATDRTYGSRTLLMDINKLEWDADMCALFGIEKGKLLELRDQGSVIGRVNGEFVRLSGIARGTPVISAGGDQQCGALGLGVMDTGTIEVNSGTGSFVISLTDKPYLENRRVICNVAAVPGMYTQEMNIIATASALDWLIREFFPEYWKDKPDYGEINRIAGETPAGSRGLFAVPHFQGCGSRDWNPTSRAGFWGFSLSARRQDMIRALYEGIAAEIAKSIDMLPEICRSAKFVAVAGGLSKSDVYNRILCDMTGRTLRRGGSAQATAMGAYISASVAMGLYGDYRAALDAVKPGENGLEFAPDPDLAKFYADYKEKTERLYRAAKDLRAND